MTEDVRAHVATRREAARLVGGDSGRKKFEALPLETVLRNLNWGQTDLPRECPRQLKSLPASVDVAMWKGWHRHADSWARMRDYGFSPAIVKHIQLKLLENKPEGV